MAKAPTGAPRTVVKQENNELSLRWMESRSALAGIWKDLPAVPSVASRRAWAVARGVESLRVHSWFAQKKAARTRNGMIHHPEDGYELALDNAPKEQPPPDIPLTIAPALDNPSSPSYLPMSSPPPQTPMDMYNEFPVTIHPGTSFGENQAVHPSSLEVFHSESHPFSSAPDIHSSKVDLIVKTEIVDAIPLSGPQAPEGRKRKVILRVTSDVEQGPSNKPHKKPGNSKTAAATARPKKQRRAKKAPKAPKTEPVDNPGGGSGPQAQFALDPPGPMMAFPQTFPAGLCAPYFTYTNPAMAFDTGMTETQNLPPHSFGQMLYNPFTGAPLFNNAPPPFSAFPGQPNQPVPFNGNTDVGHFGQMFSRFLAPALSGPSMNVPGTAPMDQNIFSGNFQGFQPGMPSGGAMNPQNPPEPTLSLLDFLNEPLDARWTYP
ncbi:hypothetical protein RSOLAG22IIIB_05093 [Rhizoctonia solani]|uniref:Homeobox domain-containing protein n=1 Tax=Rhizoctonia solani TaxID=456999 RepID=A0A0K6G3I0_9AGAM|nr:hypothetical protein RSOLAG22IIIB_05093 [Rhizoctonia solani]